LVRYSWLIPVLPALGGLVALLAGKRLGERAHLPVVAGIGASLLLSLLITFGNDHPRVATVYEWINISSPDLPSDEPTLSIPVQFRADGLSTMMISMVTFLGLLICIFSSGYMHGDPGYSRFFFCFGLFIFSMTGLVLSNNFVLTYAFWEGVGVCSYLLIGYWYHKDSAAEAAKKAFLVNRIGDFGFAVALFWLWQVVPNHNLSYGNVLNADTLAAIPHNAKLGIALLLFWAAAAKSAQIPLYVWLPDAMEGPTPVSALIHAATMVTAGVYLIARSSLLIVEVPQAQLIICATGCLTALLAALIALTQNDLKRVLAYSTVSQLGFMFMGLGAGIKEVAQFAVVAAIFHLFTHAFFKALLFLGSGSVMHAMGGILDMRRFSGLRHRLPTTFWTFAVGCVALAGLPPFAGFWSKDEILAALKQASHEGESLGYGGYYHAIYWAALFTALLTAFYTGRAFFKTFFGPEKLPSPDDPEANESFDAVASTPRAAAATFGVDTPAPESPELARYRDALGVAATSQDHMAPVAPAHGHGDHGHGHGHGHNDHGHGDHDAHFGHESPPVMTIPLVILAVCATLVGGLADRWREMADHVVTIPMRAGAESLNVSIATGILLYRLASPLNLDKNPVF
jgi:NADH-quinone oxidoreductase subunit L